MQGNVLHGSQSNIINIKNSKSIYLLILTVVMGNTVSCGILTKQFAGWELRENWKISSPPDPLQYKNPSL